MKKFMSLELSELGVGTYLGEPDEKTSQGYREVIRQALNSGINVIDTAIVYRHMKSERDIGQVVEEVGRERLFLSTKGGYLPYDIESGADPREYLQENFLRSRLIDPMKEMTAQGHCLSVGFMQWCLEKSLQNLKTHYVDVYFLHNPEEQLSSFSREVFLERIRKCFEYLEGEVRRGRVRYYGLATWNGFRVPPNHRQYLNLQELVGIAQQVAGEGHHFRFIQLPYNLGMTEAFTLKNQEVAGERLSTLEACQRLGLYTYISASILQGRVVGRVPQELKLKLGAQEDVLASLQFVLSTPGVGTALVGMSKLPHLQENLRILQMPRLGTAEFLSLFK
ncbi:MAG: aldo/keto reductase [Aquificaceae bacterium]|nr:aldo/keto reductase [Aquificaceae bacterium]